MHHQRAEHHAADGLVDGRVPSGQDARPRRLREIDRDVAEVQVAALGGKARIDASSGEITVLVPLDKEETEKLASCVKSPEAKAQVVEAVKLVTEAERAFGGTGQTRPPSPYEQQLDFFVPFLCVQEN